MLVDTIKQLGDFVRDKRLGTYGLELEGAFIVGRNGRPHLQFNGEISPYETAEDLKNPFGDELHTLPGWKRVYDATIKQARTLLDGKHKLKPTGIEASFVVTATGSAQEIMREIEAVRESLGVPQQEIYHFGKGDSSD